MYADKKENRMVIILKVEYQESKSTKNRGVKLTNNYRFKKETLFD